MACGICGGAGHNRRTCSGSGYRTSAPRRTYTCGICGQAGHNRRTCTYSESTISFSAYNGFGGISGHRSLLGINLPLTPTRTVTCGICGQQTCPCTRRLYTSASSTQNSVDTFTDVSPGSKTSDYDSDSSLTSVTSPQKKAIPSKINNEKDHSPKVDKYNSQENLIKSKSNSESSSEYRTATCGTCQEKGRNQKTCEFNSASNKGLDIPAAKPPKSWTFTCGICKNPGHIAAVCTIKNLSEQKHENPKLYKNFDTPTCLICGGRDETCKHDKGLNDLLKKAIETKRISAKREITEPKMVDSKDSWKPEVNQTLKPTFPVDKKHLTEEVQERLDKEPTNPDSEGYIYLYRDANAASGDNSLYKIGMTKNRPHLRTSPQDYAKNADNMLLFSIKPIGDISQKLLSTLISS